MCREQLPVWQREWPTLKTENARFLTVAADADLAEARRFASPYEFTTLVDTENRLAKILGYRAIPNGYVFGPDGVLLDEMVTRFDLRREGPATTAIVRGWLGLGPAGEKGPIRAGMDASTPEALDLFARGDELHRRGDHTAALAKWHAAYRADPRSMVVRKQIWRALYPERFGDVIDLDWQKGQIAREDELGFGVANPGLPEADPR